MSLECDICGLAECDLPDGVDPETVFVGGGSAPCWCLIHPDADVQRLLSQDGGNPDA